MQSHTFSQKLLNKSALHAVVSLLLQSRKFWWYLLLTSSMLIHHLIITSYCCQRYTECLATTLCSSRTVHRHTMPHTCNSWTAVSRNAKLPCIQPVASKQPRSQSCGLRDRGCHAALCLFKQIHSVDELKRRLIDVWCSLEQSIFDETIDQWRGRHWACVHAKGGHFEYRFCELTMLVLSISCTFNVTCLTITSLITKSCQQHWPIHSCLFYKVVH